MIEVNEQEGRYHGLAFTTPTGKLAVPTDYNAVFRHYLKMVQNDMDLIEDSVNVDVYFSLSRTPMKSATTRAQRAN